MIVTLRRIAMKSGKAYQIGHLYVDGQYVCDTIEDVDRGLTQSMPLSEILRIKVKSETAIPRGRYRVRMDIQSPKFSAKAYYWTFCKGYLPRLMSVPGFDGILIHKGINQRSSAGCIIVGYNTVVGQVTQSQAAFEKLYKTLKSAKDNIYIEVIK
jgi:hypothetical protein